MEIDPVTQYRDDNRFCNILCQSILGEFHSSNHRPLTEFAERALVLANHSYAQQLPITPAATDLGYQPQDPTHLAIIWAADIFKARYLEPQND